MLLRYQDTDFPGGQVVKTSPSNAGGVGLIPGQGPKTLLALQPIHVADHALITWLIVLCSCS